MALFRWLCARRPTGIIMLAVPSEPSFSNYFVARQILLVEQPGFVSIGPSGQTTPALPRFVIVVVI